MDRWLGKDLYHHYCGIVLTYQLSICSELELPIILHHLIEYLGHHNALVCGLAYTEVGDDTQKQKPTNENSWMP
jgi:hypothetical protein